MISDTKKEQLRQQMAVLGIFEEDIREKFIVGSGSGGQKLHKTASCVYLQHLPTGIEIKCQQSRSREANRFYARRRLCEKIEVIVLQEKSKKQQEIEKIRQQKRRRSRRSKNKMLEQKRQRAEIKATRSTPRKDDD